MRSDGVPRNGSSLRASEMRYRRLFETAKDGILILDASTDAMMSPERVSISGMSLSAMGAILPRPWRLHFVERREFHGVLWRLVILCPAFVEPCD